MLNLHKQKAKKHTSPTPPPPGTDSQIYLLSSKQGEEKINKEINK